MKEWLKNNVVGIVFGVIGSAGLIGSVMSEVQGMAASHQSTFLCWSASMLALGTAIGAFASGLVKRNTEIRLEIMKESEITKRTEIESDRTRDLERTKLEHEAEREIRLRKLDADIAHEKCEREKERLEQENNREKMESARDAFLSLSRGQLNTLARMQRDCGHAREFSDCPVMIELENLGAVYTPAKPNQDPMIGTDGKVAWAITKDWNLLIAKYKTIFADVYKEAARCLPETEEDQTSWE